MSQGTDALKQWGHDILHAMGANGIRAELLARRIDLVSNEPSPSGYFNFRSPFREDSRPSAGVLAVGENGSLGKYHDFTGESMSFFDFLAKVDGTTWDRVRDNLATKYAVQKPKSSKNEGKRKPDDSWVYQDESGVDLYTISRWNNADGSKRYSQGYCDAAGNWIAKKHPRQIPFMLPRLVANPSWPRIIVAGEKCAVRLQQEIQLRHFCATTFAGGENEKFKLPPDTAEYFTDCDVAILADNDETGRKFAKRLARQLYGIAKSIRIVYLPGLDEGEDIYEWLEVHHHTFSELCDVIKSAPIFEPEDNSEEQSPQIVESTSPADTAANLFVWNTPEGQTDAALAARFVAKHGDRVRYCGDWKKFVTFDGRRWCKDNTAHAEDLAKDIAPQFWALLASGGRAIGDDERRTLVKLGTYAASMTGIRALLAFARSNRTIAVTPDVFDTHPFLFNAANCTIDLQTGKTRPHDPRDFLTAVSPTPYNVDAKAPKWEATLQSVFKGNHDFIRFFQRFLGYALTGSTREQTLGIAYGDGSNGKSTLFEAFMHAVGGDYAMVAAKNLLMKKRQDSHSTEIYDLRGKRFVVCNETGQDKSFDESLVKWLTGGDRVRARQCCENNSEWGATHKIVLCTNHRPTIRGGDDGIWRRIALMPFEVHYWDESKGERGSDESLKVNKKLPKELETEAEGILAWCVQGCLEWHRDGLHAPEVVIKATKAYRQEEDTIGAFIENACHTGEGHAVKAATIHASYVAWCERDGKDPLGSKTFYADLSRRGFEKKRSDGMWYLRISVDHSQIELPREKPISAEGTTVDTDSFLE